MGWDAGGSVTVIATDAFFPPALAVIVAVPADAPLTSPVPLTVAAPSELEKAKVMPGTTLPF